MGNIASGNGKNAYDGSIIRRKCCRRDCEGHRRAVSCQANYLTLIYSLTKPVVAGMRERDGAVSAAAGWAGLPEGAPEGRIGWQPPMKISIFPVIGMDSPYRSTKVRSSRVRVKATSRDSPDFRNILSKPFRERSGVTKVLLLETYSCTTSSPLRFPLLVTTAVTRSRPSASGMIRRSEYSKVV